MTGWEKTGSNRWRCEVTGPGKIELRAETQIYGCSLNPDGMTIYAHTQPWYRRWWRRFVDWLES